MNELVGPLYYTLASDPDQKWRGLFYIFVFAMKAFAVFKQVIKTNVQKYIILLGFS